jgi:CheY-like chemotaxis protein
MDGFAASAAIRSLDTPQRGVPIIALTANALDGDRERCLAAGMSDYLPKPMKREPLRALLERWSRRPSSSPVDTEALVGSAT